ncbi:CheY-like chemotaxis protein [Aquimarina sp. MAR_2010_214]|uniref:response regulator n=1 Tax=Aquimarina sp. MAR_2010_214 TaxID=1250026 RepID=UPI000C70D9A4|nr:response regulator [Aquimarina sp. MAR_2010_214]PKV51241.1 CheY-like chemotaxis protein [Aquimarina sp. MAR_2010_214]
MLLFLYVQYRKVIKKLDEKDKELKSLNKVTEKQFRLQQDHISILSQELRTPLYGIMGLANLLEEEYPDLKNDKNLKSLKFSGDYLFTLINNVLHVNFLDSEEITVQNILFDIKEVTQNLIHSFSYATENSDNVLHFEFDSEIDQMIYGDPAILSQILMNLVSNALRFTKNGNVYFSVILIKKNEGISTISFKINHDGDELSKEDKKSIYQEFINVGNAKKTYLGTGINSKIINRLASAIDAEIIIQNDSHVGSEYALVIDFKSQQEINKEEINRDNTSFNNSIASKHKVLIVDDNKLNLLIADKILSKENFDCTTIDNGFDAIELVRENEYDIILMDINMPKLNGIGTTKRIREFNTKTPVIAITAVDVTQLNRQIVQAGLNDYILKPYNKNHLLDMIHKHINNPIPTR